MCPSSNALTQLAVWLAGDRLLVAIDPVSLIWVVKIWFDPNSWESRVTLALCDDRPSAGWMQSSHGCPGRHHEPFILEKMI